jgi:hypothetical protein
MKLTTFEHGGKQSYGAVAGTDHSGPKISVKEFKPTNDPERVG